MSRAHRRASRGMALLMTFLLMLVLAGLALAVGTWAHNGMVMGKTTLLDRQAYYVSLAGWQRARQALVAATWAAAASPGNTYTESFGAGVYNVTIVDGGSNVYTITSDGYIPTEAAPVAKREIVETQLSVTSSDGTNQALTATATASSAEDSHPALHANDNSTGTFWRASTAGSGQWLKMDFGASPPALNKVVVQENASIADNGIVLEWSDNNSTWTTFASGSQIIESPSKTHTATFTALTHRYIRATLTSTGLGSKVSVEEMRAYSSSISSLGRGEVTTQW